MHKRGDADASYMSSEVAHQIHLSIFPRAKTLNVMARIIWIHPLKNVKILGIFSFGF